MYVCTNKIFSVSFEIFNTIFSKTWCNRQFLKTPLCSAWHILQINVFFKQNSHKNLLSSELFERFFYISSFTEGFWCIVLGLTWLSLYLLCLWIILRRFRSKYHPDEFDKHQEECSKALRNRCQAFMKVYELNMLASLDAEHTNEINRVLDAGTPLFLIQLILNLCLSNI